jgi:hypothetical protein
MRGTRFYVRHRRAWTPRLWPMFVASGALSFAVTALADPSVLGAVIVGVGSGVGIGTVRWGVWKRRHPIITPGEYITDLLHDIRETARWN